MKLRSIEIALPDPAGAAAWMVDVWGLYPAEVRGQTHYLR
ncbi:glyoxalase, partial [Novosphingobium sp. ERW19]|nr:glyoxalase [Novosphingobium sp. ERW19]NLR40884.1 glyoxalase [Novosphingobium sp. ERW19]